MKWLFSQVPAALELEKFVEDVKNGVYPILSRDESRSKTSKEPTRPRAVSPDQIDCSEKSETPEPDEVEKRLCTEMTCKIETNAESVVTMTLNLKLENTNRQMVTDVMDDDSASAMTEELVKFGLVNESDRDKLTAIIEDEQRAYSARLMAASIEKPPEAVTQQPITAA